MKIYFNPWLWPGIVAALTVYWGILRTDAARDRFLLAASFLALFALQPLFSFIALGLVALTHQLVLSIRAGRLRTTQAIAIGSLAAGIVLGLGKYGQQAARAAFGGSDWITTRIVMPLGLSYFVFRLLQYLFDQVRGTIAETSFIRLATFCLFTPTLPAGPLETYQNFYGNRTCTWERNDLLEGARRILVGYFKKVFVVNILFDFLPIYARLSAQLREPSFRPDAVHPLGPLAFVILAFIHAYFDLSAYTDLAIGFSRLFGFRVMENFNRPFLQPNLSRFWRSWHISLSEWCRNNVYFPLFGLFRRNWVGLYASMLVMGLWHYVNLNWLVWGIYHGTGLLVCAQWERHRKRRRKAGRGAWLDRPWGARVAGGLSYASTFLYVALGYSFVSTHSFRHGAKLFALCLTGPFRALGF